MADEKTERQLSENVEAKNAPSTLDTRHSTLEELAPRNVIIDKRAVVIGLAAFGLLCGGAFLWRLSTQAGGVMRVLQKFEFSIAEPVPEDFELSHPQRSILQEQPEASPKGPIAVQERPDVHITATPSDAVVSDARTAQPVIQSGNVSVDVGPVSLKGLENLKSAPVDVADAPEEIIVKGDAVTYAIQPIAADVAGPGDFFKFKEPSPRDKPLVYSITQGPAPKRGLTAMPKAFGDQDAPSMGKLGPANVNLFGTSDFFRTMTEFGGSKAMAAVDLALRWLAANQDSTGIWSAGKHEGAASADHAVSALALMALMAGGHTAAKGEYRRNVIRGVEELIRRQKDNGEIDKNMYAQSICTIALCEAYGRARDERVGQAARKAVDYLVKAVNPDGGWRYTANCGLSDMSVTGWCIMALKTAKLAELKFDNTVYSQALAFVDSVTDHGSADGSNGVVTYLYKSDQLYEANDHPALTAAGMMVRQFSGVGVKSHVLESGAKLTKQLPPDWHARDFYYWYYATYAMHNMGGEYRIWWNRRIRDVLLENQARTGDAAGSWDPKGDRRGDVGGRVYTTALGALCLEVYYRYSEACNSFGVAPDLDELFFQ